MEETQDNDEKFRALCSCGTYLTHYIAKTNEIVVLWKSIFPGPVLTHDGRKVVYESRAHCPHAEFASWYDDPFFVTDNPKRDPIETPCMPEELEQATRVQTVIAQHYERLFAAHSTLVCVKSSGLENGSFFIDLVVLCKEYVPAADKEPLPDSIDGIATRVFSGFFEFCGRKELRHHRPLLPGAGFAAGHNATVRLDVPDKDFVTPTIATFGGYVVKDNNVYAVTCAHCLNDCTDTAAPVYQPCAMGNIETAGYKCFEHLEAYKSCVERYGSSKRDELHWLLRQIIEEGDGSFTMESPNAIAECGTVHGAIFGKLRDGDDDGPNVDVALVKLSDTVDIADNCTTSCIDEIFSPSLKLEEPFCVNSTIDLNESVKVYAQGAQSCIAMEADARRFEHHGFVRGGGLVFSCVFAEYDDSWDIGDSGTWCWTADGRIVGMGMGHLEQERVHYCCILPMSLVVASINKLLS